MSNPQIIIPLVIGPVSGNVELVEESWVIPRLVERIAELEEKLYAKENQEIQSQPNFGLQIQAALRKASQSVDAGLAFISGEDSVKQHLTHEATSKALTITVKKLNAMKSQMASLEEELKAANEDAAAARSRAASAEMSLNTTTKELLEEIERLKKDAELAKAAAAHATEEVQALQNHLAEAQVDRSYLESLQAQLDESKASAASWQQKHSTVESSLQSAHAETEAMKSSRASATHDLHAVRAQLADVQRQAEDFQRRFLAERLERRHLHEELQTLRGNIRVICRSRPQFDPDAQIAVSFPLEAVIKVTASQRKVSEYEFTSVLPPSTAQDEIFDSIWPLIQSANDGHNVCIFAYGQTGTGKTHTVIGTKEYPGIAPRALQGLFDIVRAEDQDTLSSSDDDDADTAQESKRKFYVSMLEIYMDSVYDLLGSPQQKEKIEILGLGPLTSDSLAAGIDRVRGRSWRQVESADEALAVLEEGCSNRAVAATALNATSSRSHVVMTLKIEDCSNAVLRSCSLLNLVDLAGSERVAKSAAEGKQLKEAQSINKSLAALGDVIAALQSGSPHVPYRNSKLTSLLQDSLGGTSKVLMVCCVAPEMEYVDETLSTLAFAQRAAAVELGTLTMATVAGGSKKTSRAQRDVGSPKVASAQQQRSLVPRSPTGVNYSKTPSPLVTRPTSARVANPNGGGTPLKPKN